MKNKNPLKIKYDEKAEALYISLGKGKIAKTEEWSNGFIIDYDKNNCIIGIEMLGVEKASSNVLKISLPEKALK